MIPALLVSLRISQFNNSREDESISREVRVLHKLAGNAGKWVKVKLPEDALADIKRHAGVARRVHYDMTLPWVEGYRVCTIASREKYSAAMDTLRAEFMRLVGEFVAAYPANVERAKEMHNGTFNASDYPDDPAACFDFGVEFSPMPESSQLAQVVSGPALEKMQAELEKAKATRLAEAAAEVWRRLLEPVQNLALKLADPNAVFKDSLVENVVQMIDTVPGLNLTGDPKIPQALAQVRASLASLDPDTLRNNRPLRRASAEAAAGIVKTFGALGARKLTPAT